MDITRGKNDRFYLIQFYTIPIESYYNTLQQQNVNFDVSSNRVLQLHPTFVLSTFI